MMLRRVFLQLCLAVALLSGAVAETNQQQLLLFGKPRSAVVSVCSQSTTTLARSPFSGMTAQQKVVYGTLICSLVSGGVWANLDDLLVLAAPSSSIALTNLISASFTGTAVNSPTFTANKGYAGDGLTKYIDSGYNPATSGVTYTQNLASMGVWDLTASSDGKAAAGAYSGGAGTDLGPGGNKPGTSLRVNSTGDPSSSVTNAYTPGVYHINRANSASISFSVNGGSPTTLSSSSFAPYSSDIFICGFNVAGSFFAASSSSDQMAVWYVGGSLTPTQITTMYNALHAFLHAIGAV